MRNPFERWHPKIALRYLPVVSEIKRSRLKDPQVLEIGSGSLGVAPYLKMPVVGVDIDFSGPTSRFLQKVKAEATKLPFGDQSFDFVVVMDLVEHLPEVDRPKVIQEALRCARKMVFFGIPCGKASLKQDKELAQYYHKVYGTSYPFLTEHLKYGLPEKQEILDIIKTEAENLGQGVEIKTFGNINLTLRNFLMKGWITQNRLVDFIFRKIFLLFIPIFRLINLEPTYRKLFFVRIK